MTFQYDAFTRVKKVKESTTTRYYFGIAEKTGTSWSKIYVATPAGTPEWDNGVVYYKSNDHLGNTRIITTGYAPVGSVAGRLDLYPYGEIWSETGTTTKFKFTGKERDAGSDNDDFGARNYFSRSGRFLSTDPISARLKDPQSLNKYAYARNEPIGKIDTDGRQWRCFDAGGGLQPGFSKTGYLVGPFLGWCEYDPDDTRDDGGSGNGGDRGSDGSESYGEKTARALARAMTAVRDKNLECNKFLTFVIADLGAKGNDGNLLTPEALVNLLTGLGTIKDDAGPDQTRAPAYVEGGVLHLTKDAYTSYLYATLIHEAFHIKGFNNNDVLSAMKKYKPEGWGPLPGAGDERTGYVARYCGIL